MRTKKNSLNEVINVNENKVFVDNGEIKKILNKITNLLITLM